VQYSPNVGDSLLARAVRQKSSANRFRRCRV